MIDTKLTDLEKLEDKFDDIITNQQDKIDDLESQIDNLNWQVTDLKSTINSVDNG